MKPTVDVIVGGQYGSEAKGKIAGYLAPEYKAAVRGGSENAGHTVYYKDQPFKMQVIPVAWVNPKCKLYIGAGASFSTEQLLKELDWTGAADRLRIDPNAVIIEQKHKDMEAQMAMGGKIGSTSHGCGAALIDKLWRVNGVKLAKDLPELGHFWNGQELGFTRVSVKVAHHVEHGEPVMLEGTQGTMLSIDHTMFYPYCTSRNVTAGGIIGECGVAPTAVRDVILVFRAFPIRVGGNSGPTGSREMTWAEVSKRAGREVEEFTTVTNKRRRVFEFSWAEGAYAMHLNRPSMLALTFVDYFGNENQGARTMRELNQEARNFVYRLEDAFKVKVALISTGPKNEDIIDRRGRRGFWG